MADLLLPELDELTEPFWAGCRQRQLRVQQCPRTLHLIHPPRHRSPWAPDARPNWVTVSGRGHIWSVAEPHAPLIPQFAELAPYNVIIVALVEDPSIRLVGNLVAHEQADIGSIPYDAVTIGAPVRVVFQPVAGPVEATAPYLFPRWIYS